MPLTRLTHATVVMSVVAPVRMSGPGACTPANTKRPRFQSCRTATSSSSQWVPVLQPQQVTSAHGSSCSASSVTAAASAPLSAVGSLMRQVTLSSATNSVALPASSMFTFIWSAAATPVASGPSEAAGMEYVAAVMSAPSGMNDG